MTCGPGKACSCRSGSCGGGGGRDTGVVTSARGPRPGARQAGGFPLTSAFANNQELTCIAGTTSEITTDPVNLNGYDRASVKLNVHSIWALGGGVTTVAYQA